MDVFRTLVPIVLGAALAASAAAGTPTTVESFDGGVNLANWSYVPAFAFAPVGGNPGAYAEGDLSNTKIPRFTTQWASVFTGDFRGRNVTHLGIDLLVDAATDPGGPRPVVLRISSLSCTMTLELSQQIPQAGAGWVSYDVVFDPQGTTMPAGWVPGGSLCTDPDATWNTIMENVRSVEWNLGDPALFSTYEYGDWLVGADNARLTEDNPWVDLGGGSPGILGVPCLQGAGALTPGSSVTLALDDVLGASPVLLWMSAAPVPFPALGGTVHAHPFAAQIFAAMDFSGHLVGSANMPPAASGTELTFQFICQDVNVPAGLTLSNAVRGTVP